MSGKAIILAAGKSSKFFPPLYDKPKGLFTFRGEVLIERQIRQLLEAGIDDITVVIGYEKERFFYLERAFPVKLVVSTRYNDESNLSSLDLVRDALGGAYLCCADHWYADNPFLGGPPACSTRLVEHRGDASREIVVRMGADRRLVDARAGAHEGLCMVGWAYFTDEFANRFYELYDEERGRIGMKSMLWEQFWALHEEELALYGVEPSGVFREFDSLADLQAEDAGVLENVASAALGNICRLLECEKDAVSHIEPLNKGLTNVSFTFDVAGRKYVYRHPGASSSNMVNRAAEVVAQREAMNLGIDSSVIDIGSEGWKLSDYVYAVRDFSYDDDELLSRGIDQIRRFQESGVDLGYEVDLLSEGDRLLGLAYSKKSEAIGDLGALRSDLQRLWHHFELDGWGKVPCHNDTYVVNWIVGEDALCLIDWEYAGMNDRMNDIATLVVRDGLDDEVADRLMLHYFGDEPTFEQRRHAYACFALCGWYWYSWSLFKDTLGEDGFFMLPSWRALNKYLPLALEMYEG